MPGRTLCTQASLPQHAPSNTKGNEAGLEARWRRRRSAAALARRPFALSAHRRFLCSCCARGMCNMLVELTSGSACRQEPRCCCHSPCTSYAPARARRSCCQPCCQRSPCTCVAPPPMLTNAAASTLLAPVALLSVLAGHESLYRANHACAEPSRRARASGIDQRDTIYTYQYLVRIMNRFSV